MYMEKVSGGNKTLFFFFFVVVFFVCFFCLSYFAFVSIDNDFLEYDFGMVTSTHSHEY